MGTLLGVVGLSVTLTPGVSHATTMTQSGALGLSGTISVPPPTQAATITIPNNGQTLSGGPITVSGTCPSGLLVEIFSNNVFAGSQQCSGGTFSVKTSLFSGSNQLEASVYDALGQSGPASNMPTVQYSSALFSPLGPLLTLSSSYATRGANPGEILSWPIVISGGTGPYSLSIYWGDGTQPQSQAAPFSGNVTIAHTYKMSGSYNITIKATDKNGETAFLQLVGVANGPITPAGSTSSSPSTSNTSSVIWWPAAVILPLLFVAFWLGGAHKLTSLKKRLDSNSDRLQ